MTYIGRIISAVLLCTAACTAPPPNDFVGAAQQLVDGSTLSSLTTSDTLVFLAMIDPGLCLSCDASIAEFMLLRQRRPERVKLVFLREPTDLERRHLTLARTVEDGVLAAGQRVNSATGPQVLVVHANGQSTVVDFARGLAELRASYLRTR